MPITLTQDKLPGQHRFTSPSINPQTNLLIVLKNLLYFFSYHIYLVLFIAQVIAQKFFYADILNYTDKARITTKEKVLNGVSNHPIFKHAHSRPIIQEIKALMKNKRTILEDVLVQACPILALVEFNKSCILHTMR